MQSPLTGIVPPMVTPLLSRDELDVGGLERLIEHILAGGVSGLFILGTTGEGPSLGYRLRKELIERTCRAVAGRAAVLVGITDTAFVESVNVARWAAEAGADAVVAAPPCYLPQGQPELREYIAHLVAELPLPLYLYNMPGLTKVAFEAETLCAATAHARILGLKDSSGNMTYFHRGLALKRERPDWSFLMGPEELLFDSVLAGGHGGVNGGANLFPRVYVDLYEAARAGDLPRARALHAKVLAISGTLYQVGRHASAIIKGIKCVLSLQGVCSDFMAEPFHRFREPERERIGAALAKLEEME